MLDETVVRRQVVFKGKYLQAELRTVRLPDGSESTREIVIPRDAVGILPVDEAGNVYLVRQFRNALERVILEIPAGILEEGEDPESAGRRECEEEVGLIPKEMEKLCGFHHSVGFSTGRIEIYLATGLKTSTHVHQEHGEFLERVTLPFHELYRMALSGEIVDSKTLVAALWYQQRLDR